MVLLEGGRMIEEGSPEEIFTAAKEQRTRDFLGHVL
jgi:polar amino acid transport system ATP-binding protein